MSAITQAKRGGEPPMPELLLDGQDYTGLYADLSYYLHHPERGSTDTARLLAMACDNPTGDLLIWLATHQGQTVDIDATCRGAHITGRVTITGATRWEFDGEASSQPME